MNNETEKAAFVTEQMNKGFEQAKDATSTTSVSFQQLSNDVGDFFQVLGGGAARLLDLANAFQRIRQQIKAHHQ